MLSDRQTHTAWQLITITLDEVSKSMVGIQLTVDILWLSSIQYGG